MIKQWLLFDPLCELEARSLLADLRTRVPVLSMNTGANFRIPVHELHVSSLATYDGSLPTLIPAHLTPAPTWLDATGACSWNGKDVLETTLASCPSVTDERVLAALDLYIASQYDFLPRSLFLAKLTILDALAAHAKRNAVTTAWIDEKLIEAEAFCDAGLSSALRNLKFESHTAAIRALVRRAVLSLGGTEKEAALQATAAGRLYAARSRLSHAGSTVELDLGGATQLARLVLNAVVRNPSILDVVGGEEASVISGLRQRKQWIAEAEAAIRTVQPNGAAVVDAIRRPLILGQHGALTARLADGSDWWIGDGTARRLSAEDIAEWARFPEAFQ
ncbi:hypothetical protein [Paraburkholderia bryophila]|uniref:Apea-like HEPN domain-containing protein n=1 Tax=Paraburkholderia bryophila TaxID=420952 RepID=A0A7Y9WN71_9BURK|nr:hypothetical protein [Paraburkholderia bryophila]NYH22868.1 hypothetical protein [Paraburkholderia bryophila]